MIGLIAAAPVRAQDKSAPEKKTASLPEPPAMLASLLKVYEKEPEPVREVKRLFASSLYYLIERDAERFLACFHKDFQIHQGVDFVKLPPDELRALVAKNWQTLPKSTISLQELVELDKARAYTRAQAKKWIGDWKKQPSEIAKIMEDGDYLVMAPTNKKALGEKASDFDAEVFYVVRQQDGVWKIAIGE
ncbi:MAG: hypothetical protein ACAI25_13180 [Planctomycetota bacterium]